MKKLLLIFCVATSLSWTAYVRTDGFSSWIIEGALKSEGASPLAAEVREILAQPFKYMGKGRQCFVFESQDGRTVLKFFNQTYLQMPWYAFLVGDKEGMKRNKRRAFYEHSYEIAFREFGEEILYLHMSQGGNLPTIQIRDKSHRLRRIDLNRVPFVLQRKGQPFYEGLQAVYEKEGMEGLCREIDAFIAQVAQRISKNIADADSDVEHNWGYVNGKIFHLDPGRLYIDPSLECLERRQKEWHTATHQFVKWLKEKYPEAVLY